MIGMHKKLLEGDLIKQINYIQEFVPFYNILVCKQSKYVITTKPLETELEEFFLKDNLL